MEVMQKKCGSGSTLREFRRLVMAIAKEDAEYNHMPDYQIRVDVPRDQLIACSRGTVGDDRAEMADIPPLATDPNGDTVSFRQRTVDSGGMLDFDANAGNFTTMPVENIFWPAGQAPSGVYTVNVNLFRQNQGEAGDLIRYDLRLLVQGQVRMISNVVSADNPTDTFTFRVS